MFPSAIDSFQGFTGSETLQAANHAAQENQQENSIIAIETKLGTGASTPTAGNYLRGNGTGTTAFDTVHMSEVQGVLATANGGNGTASTTGTGAAVFATNPNITNPIESNGTYNTPTINNPTINGYPNSSIPGAAITSKSIAPSQLNLTNTGPDANGWYKKDYGNWELYEQTVLVNVSVSNGNLYLQKLLSPPVGITDSSTLRFQVSWMGNYIGRMFAGIDDAGTYPWTSAALYLYNVSAGNITALGQIFVQAITV